MKKTLFTSIIFLSVIFFQHQVIAQWIKSNGVEPGHAYAITSNGTNVFAGVYSKGIFRSTDNGSNFTIISSPVTDAVSLTTVGSTIFAGNLGTFGSVFRSLDNGANWTQVLSTLGMPCFGVLGSTLFSGPCGGGPIRRTTDYGDNWEAVNTGLTMSWVMAFGTFNSEIYAATDYGHLFRSDDLGDHWTETGYSGNTILSIHKNENALYVGTQTEGTVFGSVFYSTDDGQNWTNTGLDNYIGLSGCNITSILSIGDKIFIGTNGYGVFLYTSNGSGWTNVGLESKAAWQLIIVGDEMIAATSFGVWKRPVSEMITSVEEQTSSSLSEYVLSQNYPNPLNPSTTFKYSIPKSSQVTLKIFNTLGEEIMTLVNEEKAVGTYEINFDASQLTSGVYFYRLQAGDFVQTRKMILLK